jgi:hypothetical protein
MRVSRGSFNEFWGLFNHIFRIKCPILVLHAGGTLYFYTIKMRLFRR